MPWIINCLIYCFNLFTLTVPQVDQPVSIHVFFKASKINKHVKLNHWIIENDVHDMHNISINTESWYSDKQFENMKKISPPDVTFVPEEVKALQLLIFSSRWSLPLVEQMQMFKLNSLFWQVLQVLHVGLSLHRSLIWRKALDAPWGVDCCVLLQE